MKKRLIAGMAALTLLPAVAMAQRPPSPGQGPPQLSFSRVWDWLMARPGVIVALIVLLGALIYMVATRKKPEKPGT